MPSPEAHSLARQAPPGGQLPWRGIAAACVVVLAGAAWGAVHHMAAPGSDISLLWGLAHYRKAGAEPPAAAPAIEGAVRAMSLSTSRSDYKSVGECSSAFNGALGRAFPDARVRAKSQVLWVHTGRYSAVVSCADYSAAVLVVAGPDARRAEDMHASVLAQLGR